MGLPDFLWMLTECGQVSALPPVSSSADALVTGPIYELVLRAHPNVKLVYTHKPSFNVNARASALAGHTVNGDACLVLSPTSSCFASPAVLLDNVLRGPAPATATARRQLQQQQQEKEEPQGQQQQQPVVGTAALSTPGVTDTVGGGGQPHRQQCPPAHHQPQQRHAAMRAILRGRNATAIPALVPPAADAPAAAAAATTGTESSDADRLGAPSTRISAAGGHTRTPGGAIGRVDSFSDSSGTAGATAAAAVPHWQRRPGRGATREPQCRSGRSSGEFHTPRRLSSPGCDPWVDAAAAGTTGTMEQQSKTAGVSWMELDDEREAEGADADAEVGGGCGGLGCRVPSQPPVLQATPASPADAGAREGAYRLCGVPPEQPGTWAAGPTQGPPPVPRRDDSRKDPPGGAFGVARPAERLHGTASLAMAAVTAATDGATAAAAAIMDSELGTAASAPCWGDLAGDVVGSIALHLPQRASQLQAMASACRGWRAALLEHSPLPLLRSISFHLDPAAPFRSYTHTRAPAPPYGTLLSAGERVNGAALQAAAGAAAGEEAAEGDEGARLLTAAVVRQYAAGAFLLPSHGASRTQEEHDQQQQQGGKGGRQDIRHNHHRGRQHGGPELDEVGEGGSGAAQAAARAAAAAVLLRGGGGGARLSPLSSLPRLLVAAAHASNPSAQLVLAQLLEAADDERGSLRWWRKLAAGGDVMAMFKLGMACYDGSHGLQPDPESAHLWLGRTVRALLRVDSLAAISLEGHRGAAATASGSSGPAAAAVAGQRQGPGQRVRQQGGGRISPVLQAKISALDAPRLHMLGWSSIVLGYLEFDGVAGRAMWGAGERSEAVRLFRLAEICGLAEAAAVLGWIYNTGQY